MVTILVDFENKNVVLHKKHILGYFAFHLCLWRFNDVFVEKAVNK